MAPLRVQSPLVIGGTGGSGTRLVQQIFEKSGFFMGMHLNRAMDTMDFEPFLDKIINQILRHTRSVDYHIGDLPAPLKRDALAELETLIAGHYRKAPPDAADWGWKNPRSIYILPLIHALCPDFAFIHVVRDGRDMALSDNRNQLEKHFAALFGKPIEKAGELRSAAAMWQKVNLGAASFLHRMECRRLLVRYEDLCGDPAALAHIRDIFALPELDFAALVEPDAAIGRYKSLNAQDQAIVEKAGREGLKFFRYLKK